MKRLLDSMGELRFITSEVRDLAQYAKTGLVYRYSYEVFKRLYGDGCASLESK
jgi:hypothetical protein